MLLLKKIILGISLAAPIGLVSVEMIERGLSHGFWSAFVVRIGGALGNTLCLVMATLGLSFLLQSPVVKNLCSLIGAVVLIYLGLKSVIKAKHINVHLQSGAAKKSYMNGIMTGLFLSIANPMGIIFWISIFAASYDLNAHSNQWSGFIENTAIILGVLLWGAMLSGALELGRRFFNHRMIQVINLVAGATLVCFGVWFGTRALFILQTNYFG